MSVKSSRCLSLVFLALVLAACTGPVESWSPLQGAPEAEPDHRLTGAWYVHQDEGVILLYVPEWTDSDPFQVLAVMAEHGREPPASWITAIVEATVLDGETFYNVRHFGGADYSAEGEHPGFIIMQTEFSDQGALTLRFMSHKLVKDFIESKRVGGRILDGHYNNTEVEYVMLELGREELLALIRDTPRETLFSMTFGPLYRLQAGAENAEMRDRGGKP
jgi:hypothetical protein